MSHLFSFKSSHFCHLDGLYILVHECIWPALTVSQRQTSAYGIAEINLKVTQIKTRHHPK